MSNPVATLIEWLKSQETDVQQDIAFLMSGLNPIFDGVNRSEEILEAFYQRCEIFSGTDIQNPGFIIAFRAIFDFAIVKKRGTDEGWNMPKSIFESIIESNDPEMPSGMKEKALESLKNLPARREKWKAVCNSWEKLTTESLADNAVESWERDNMLERGKDINKPISLRVK